MRSVSGATSIAASAGRRHQSRRRALQATRRLRALRGVDGPEKVVETARKSVETFIQRVRGVAVGRVDAYRSASSARTAQASSSNTLQTLASKALPILLGHEDERLIAREDDVKAVETRSSGELAVELTRARVESLLKPDAGRDDIFQAAGQGLTGVDGTVVPIGWWDAHSEIEATPELELQALNDGSRAQLIGSVLLALKEALENAEESGGSLRELIKRVARVSANDWMCTMSLDVGAQDRCARVVSLAGDAADEKIWQSGDVVEGSKVALYAGVLMYLAKISKLSGEKVDAVEVVKSATEVVAPASEPVLEFFNSPMASVCVTVLQDVVLNIADSVASAYLTCARESRAKMPLNGGIVRTEEAGGIARVPPFRDALSVRLKSSRSLEKFRNSTSMRSWLERNYYDVIAMYEDWHKIWGMNEHGELVTRKIYVCRQPELQKVKGLRLFVSMFLEVSDVSLPLFRSALNNFSRVASWLLVTLIGRSLGLVYRGIKESLDPQSRVKFT